MALVFGAIAPHGGLAIAEACSPEERDLALATRAGMEELGRIFDAAQPDVVVVATPHNVHIANAFGVIVSSRVAGDLPGSDPSIALDLPTDAELAWAILDAFAEARLPATGVSFGANEPSTAMAPMDWGVLIPLWFMGGRHRPPIPLVVVTPSRDLPAETHVAAGAAIARAAERSDRRVAFIASADHGHAHLREGPYGYHKAAAEYDQLIATLVRTGKLEGLLEIPAEMVENAKADSWWQMLMLHGATGGWQGRLISYEAPTYFGMLTAAYEPAAAVS
jgi:aromatic ring-opening dioxygenase LigB subunit